MSQAGRRQTRRRAAGATALLAAAVAAALPAAAEPPHARPEIKSHHTFLAELNEAIVSLPVTVALHDGREVTESLLLTHFRPKGAGPFPLVVYSHGRGPDRGDPSRTRPLPVALYWLRRGFAVLAPTRIGYGATAAALDPEGFPGGCKARRLEPQLAATVRQIHAVLDWAAAQPWADTTRVILHGGSLGGFSSLVALAEQRPGVLAAVNFAGGSGGSPKLNPTNPCRPELVAAALAAAAPRARVPSLWIYAENDKYWGAHHPRTWHAAWTGAGGRAELHMLPAVGEDGHQVFTAGFATWRPIADRFLAGLGFPPPRSADAPPATAWAPLDDTTRLPYADSPRKLAGYERFLKLDVPRAFVVGPPTAWAYASGHDALARALEHCRKNAPICHAYAVDDAVVWEAPPALPAKP